MTTPERYYIAMKIERLAPLVRGILFASSMLEDLEQRHGIRYKVAHKASDHDKWDCGEFHLLKLQQAPERLQQLLHLEEIDQDVLSQWTAMELLEPRNMTTDSRNHQQMLLARVLEAIPPGIFVIPESAPKRSTAQDLKELGQDSNPQDMPELNSPIVDNIEASGAHNLEADEPATRLGRRPIRDDEIELERVSKVLKDFNRRRRENPTKTIERIEREINMEFEVAPRTLRDWRRKYEGIVGT